MAAGAAAVALPIIGGIAGGILQAKAEKAASRARSEMQLLRASELEMQSFEVKEAGRVAAGLQMTQTRAARSSVTAEYARSGVSVGEGSAGVGETQTYTLGLLDAYTIRANAEKEARTIEREVRMMRQSAGDEIVAGNAFRVAGAVKAGFGAGGSALSALDFSSFRQGGDPGRSSGVQYQSANRYGFTDKGFRPGDGVWA